MIDVAREISAFDPIDTAHVPDKYRPATEYMRRAFIMYNKALHEVNIGHIDTARNLVKQAVSMFPDFYEAIVVYGILVFANGNRTGAVRIFNSVKDIDLREEAVRTFDRLVKEADKPEASKGNDNGQRRYTGNADSVIDRSAYTYTRTAPAEAKYSKGRVFERSSGYYESQPQKRSYDDRRQHADRGTQAGPRSRAGSRSRDLREAPHEERNDASDFRLLNKYLLIIVAVLLIFSIVVSTMLVNKTASERSLKEQLRQATSSSAAGRIGFEPFYRDP